MSSKKACESRGCVKLHVTRLGEGVSGAGLGGGAGGDTLALVHQTLAETLESTWKHRELCWFLVGKQHHQIQNQRQRALVRETNERKDQSVYF